MFPNARDNWEVVTVSNYLIAYVGKAIKIVHTGRR